MRGGKSRILVLANQAMGDTLIKLPFFLALRSVFPREKYHIAIILSRQMAPAIAKLEIFDEVIEEALSPCRHVFFWVFGLGAFKARALRWAICNKAEVLINCDRYRDLGCDFAVRLCGPTLSMAYSSDLMPSLFPVSAAYQKRVFERKYTYLQRPTFTSHQIDDLFRFLSFAAKKKFSPSLTNRSELFPLLDFSLNEAFKLKQNGYAVFVPGAGASYRRWPISRFAEIVKLVSAMGMKIAVVGGRKESSLVSDLAQASGVGALDLSGKTTIQQLGGLLCHAKLVVSNETGAATFAAVLGVKTICILGGGDFGSFFPNEYFPNTISVYHKEPCFSCGWKCAKIDLSGFSVAPCIAAISVEDVKTAVKSLLNTAPAKE